MASAEEFFQRLRARVAARTAPTPEPPVLPPPPATVATRERFFEELTRIGAVPHATDRAHVAEVTLAIARASRSASFTSWRDGLVEELGLASQLVASGLQRLDGPPLTLANRPELARASLVVSGCDLAFAENGALLLRTNAQRGRLLTALARIHVAIVGKSQLVYGLESLPEALRRLGMPSGAVLHTGPTFSGDIEAIVIVGAHGPAELHVVWVDDA